MNNIPDDLPALIAAPIDTENLDPKQDAGDGEKKKRAWRGGGMPRKEIDYNIFENLCKIFCTEGEICDIFGIARSTLSDRIKEHYFDEETGEPLTFQQVYKMYSAYGFASIRRDQFRSSRGGNVLMQIWLGKQYLGQRDKVDARVENVKPVQIYVDNQKTFDDIQSVVNKIMFSKDNPDISPEKAPGTPPEAPANNAE